MATKRIDPRVVRTKAELKAAMYEQLKKHRWEKIRVQDILEETGISRSAFYAHYGNKFDLLLDGIPDLHIQFNGERPDFLPLFVHLDEFAAIMRPLLSQPVLGEIVDDYHRNLAAMWANYLAETKHGGDWILPELLAGGLLAIARAYATQHPSESPAAVNERYNHFVHCVLADAHT